MTVFGSAWPARPFVARAPRPWRSQAALAALAVGLAPGLAFAQSTGKPLTIGLYASAVHDSNPAQASQQVETLRGLQGSEWIFSPGATITYGRNTGRQLLSLEGRAGYDFHEKNDELSREHIAGTLNYRRSFGSLCSVGATLGYDRAQSQLQDLIIGVTKNASQSFRAEANQTCGTASGLTENLSAQYLNQSNSNDALAGFSTVGVSGGLGYSSHTVGNVALMVSHAVTSYDSGAVAGIPVGVRQSDLKLTGIGVQLDRPIGSRLSGSAGIFYSRSTGGVLRIASLVNREDNFKGVTANASLNYQVGPRLRLAARASRNVGGTSRPDQGYALSTIASLSGAYTMSSRLSTGAGYEWKRDDYRGGSAALPSFGPSVLTVSSLFANVKMQIGRNSSLAADVRYQDGNADLAAFDYKTTRIGLTASTQF